MTQLSAAVFAAEEPESHITMEVGVHWMRCSDKGNAPLSMLVSFRRAVVEMDGVKLRSCKDIGQQKCTKWSYRHTENVFTVYVVLHE
jgi:hypothetical protein